MRRVAEFARRLTLLDFVLIGVGGSIGSGIFRTPSQVAAALPSPGWMLTAWALGGAMTLAGALSFAELGAAMPRAGGQYVWLSEAYGGLVGFLHGWAYFVVVVSGALAALAVLAAVNVVGVRVAALVGDLLTVAKLAALALIVVVALWKGGGAHAASPAAAALAEGGASSVAGGLAAGVGAGGVGLIAGLGAAMVGVL